MGKVKIPYYTVRRRHGKVMGYWQPTKAMRESGFALVSCGLDGPEAWRKAQEWANRWKAHRLSMALEPAPRWPEGSIGDAYDRYRQTKTWARKAKRTQEDWERGWRHIQMWGECRPSTMTLDIADAWYSDLLKNIGVREAHRAMKIWRALWIVCGSLGLCDPTKDPSRGIRRVTPVGRSATWKEGEVVRLAKSAWRMGYHGAAAIIAIAWDTGFSPVDARRLAAEHRYEAGFRIPRAKTGKAAIGTLSKRTERLLSAYLKDAGDLIPSAPLFRNRSGAPYSKDTLGDDFRTIREFVFPGETRKLMDVRRSVAIEALAGGAQADQIGGKLANSISTNRELERTYLPGNDAVVRQVDQARIVGRQAIRRTKV